MAMTNNDNFVHLISDRPDGEGQEVELEYDMDEPATITLTTGEKAEIKKGDILSGVETKRGVHIYGVNLGDKKDG